MKTVCAYILAICPPQRLEWLKQCIDHLEKQPFKFDRKLVVFDEFNGHSVTEDIITFLQNKTWEYKIVNYHSRSRTMKETLTDIKEEYIFYIEDDVLLDLPSKEEIMPIFDIVIDNRECGHISPQIGDGRFCATNKVWSDVEFLQKNTILKTENLLAFKRMEEFKTEYFITFPCVLFRTKLFKECIDVATEYFKGRQIETGITSAYFSAGFDKHYYKATICKLNTFEKLNENMLNERACGFVTVLDPLQGYNVCGGGNFIT